MSELLLHDDTRRSLDAFVAKPSHAVLLIAPTGAGKSTVAQFLAAQLLETDSAKLSGHPYFRLVSPVAGKSISIEAVRDVIHFLMLKTASAKPVSRVVIIENASVMTLQAQNALLKTIEEPPAGTVLILTAASELGLLPTIRSRAQRLTIQPPSTEAIGAYFATAGYKSADIDKALLMSDGLTGLAHALLTDAADHPLVPAVAAARTVLQAKPFERLTLVDDLAKDKQAWLNTLTMISRMADIALKKAGTTETIRKWHTILAAAHRAEKQTLQSAQPKLVVLNFMLQL